MTIHNPNQSSPKMIFHPSFNYQDVYFKNQTLVNRKYPIDISQKARNIHTPKSQCKD